mmetsp:Transcript_142607/g.247071  ORF Transcript_142607/g.247071 Transcript_142607/m.247071 type:complete len:173 (-) Transcript_142607:68-586(-)
MIALRVWNLVDAATLLSLGSAPGVESSACVFRHLILEASGVTIEVPATVFKYLAFAISCSDPGMYSFTSLSFLSSCKRGGNDGSGAHLVKELVINLACEKLRRDAGLIGLKYGREVLIIWAPVLFDISAPWLKHGLDSTDVAPSSARAEDAQMCEAGRADRAPSRAGATEFA